MASGSNATTASPLLPNGKPENAKSTRKLVTDSIATGVVFALILTVGQRGIGFVRGLLFCRYMSEQQLGQWSLIWSFLMTLIPLAVLGLPGCLGRYTEHYKVRGQLGYFVKRIGFVSAILTLTVATFMIVAPSTCSELVFRDASQTSIIYAMAFCLVMVSLSNFLGALMESLRQVRVVTLMRFATGFLFATLGLGLVVWGPDAAIGATIGFGISSLVGSIPAFWILYRYRDSLHNTGDYLPQFAMWNRLAPFAAWLWVSNFFHNCFELSDRYMLLFWSPVSADLAQGLVGQYHSGRQIPLLMVSLATMLGGVLMPYLSAHWEKGDREEACKQVRWTLKLMSLAFTMGGIFVLMLAPFIFETILQSRYDEGFAVLPLTLVYCIWFSLTTVGQDYLWTAERGKWSAVAIFFCLIGNLVLNTLLIPYHGVHGAVLATAISNGFLLASIYMLNHYFGCKSDVGIWLCAGIPFTLLLPVPWAFAVAVAIAVLGWKSTFILHEDEKAEITGHLSLIMRKLGIR